MYRFVVGLVANRAQNPWDEEHLSIQNAPPRVPGSSFQLLSWVGSKGAKLPARPPDMNVSR